MSIHRSVRITREPTAVPPPTAGMETLATMAGVSRSDGILIGSSDVAKILGLSKWGTPGDAWAALIGLIPRYKTVATQRVLRRGRIVEDGIIHEWIRTIRPARWERGPQITDEGAEPAIVAPDGWRAFRPDAVAVMPDGEVVMLEAKTTRDWDDWGYAGTSDVPLYYACQVAWQFGVARAVGMWKDIDLSKCSRIDVAGYCPMDEDFRTYPCTYGPSVPGLAKHVQRWMEKHVWADVPVPPHLPGLDTIGEIFGKGGVKKEFVEPIAEDRDAHARLLELDAVIDAAEEEWDRIEAEIKVRIGNAYGINGVATWGHVNGGESIAVSVLRAQAPDLYEALKTRGLVKTKKDSRSFLLKRPSKAKKKARTGEG